MREMDAAHGTMAYNQLITAAANAHDLRAAEAVYKEQPGLLEFTDEIRCLWRQPGTVS